MKETILFSNVIGDITALDEDCSFNPNLVCILRNANCENKNLVFINAPIIWLLGNGIITFLDFYLQSYTLIFVPSMDYLDY